MFVLLGIIGLDNFVSLVIICFPGFRWQSNMGNADLKARYDKSYLINIPSLHMVLFLINSQPETRNPKP